MGSFTEVLPVIITSHRPHRCRRVDGRGCRAASTRAPARPSTINRLPAPDWRCFWVVRAVTVACFTFLSARAPA